MLRLSFRSKTFIGLWKIISWVNIFFYISDSHPAQLASNNIFASGNKSRSMRYAKSQITILESIYAANWRLKQVPSFRNIRQPGDYFKACPIIPKHSATGRLL
jgi:hypothetical protein